MKNDSVEKNLGKPIRCCEIDEKPQKLDVSSVTD